MGEIPNASPVTRKKKKSLNIEKEQSPAADAYLDTSVISETERRTPEQ